LKFPPFDRYPVLSIRTGPHETAYIRYGQGPALVLLHGYAGAIWNWEYQLEELGARFTLYIPDILGQGLSAKPRIAYTPAAYVDWLLRLLDALNLPQAHFVGSSMGAGLALGFALAHPDRVEKLVLVSGLPPQVLNCARGPYLKMFSRLGSGMLFGLAYRLMGRRAFRKLLRGIICDEEKITPAVIERAYRLRKDHGRAWPLWSSLRHLEIWEEELAPRLTKVAAPVLIIWGRDDRFFPLEVGENLHRLIPGSRLTVIPNAGHLPMWERPEIVNRVILDFLT
jgi:pimeloyl-ACP methyl ester carboxylesterase